MDVGIAVEGVGLTFPAQRGTPTVALAATTCRFAAGRVTAIIGPSGCGKSTLLQIIRGFLAPTTGRIGFIGADGTPLASPPAMATVWQSFNLFPWRSVLDNVCFGLEAAGMPRWDREARARAALAQVDLTGFEAKFPRQLSGGMRQRVGIARALVMDPDVILLDEPFGALDAQTRLVLQDQLTALVETTRKTVVLVTHSIEEAILLADTVLVMTARPGRIAAEIAVDLPRPRDHLTARQAAGVALFDRIHGLLRDEVLLAMRAEAAA
jgi:NitT/TauT family transport system ATP-binding protein